MLLYYFFTSIIRPIYEHTLKYLQLFGCLTIKECFFKCCSSVPPNNIQFYDKAITNFKVYKILRFLYIIFLCGSHNTQQTTSHNIISVVKSKKKIISLFYGARLRTIHLYMFSHFNILCDVISIAPATKLKKKTILYSEEWHHYGNFRWFYDIRLCSIANQQRYFRA